MRVRTVVGLVLCFPLLLANHSCGHEGETGKHTQAEKAARAANSIQFNENAEIDNIKRRLELTSNPGQLGFILLLNEMGQPVYYAGVTGKVTSGGKRLTRPQDSHSYNGAPYVMDAPSDEGTWGSSSEYIFFWTTDGQYIQWNGKYLYSDKPFRLSVEPLAVSVEPTPQ